MKNTMSNIRNFRVIVNLCNFFHDHRSRVRIFINEKIQTISDLQNRIEEIFGISNFHLVSQNEYLPPTEDTRILHTDDIVWVMRNTQTDIPKTDIQITSNIETEHVFKRNKKRLMSPKEDIVDAPRKKKKKKFRIEQSEEECLDLSNQICKSKKKKHKDDSEQVKKLKKKLESSSKQKKTHKDIEKKEDIININHEVLILEPEISSSDNKNYGTIDVVESLKPSSYNSPTSEQISLSSKINTGTEIKSILSGYKKREPVPTITKKYLEQNKVNIVKIEYLSGGPDEIKQLELKHNGNDKSQQSDTLNENLTPNKTIKSKFDENTIIINNSQDCSTLESEKSKHKETDTIETKMYIDDDNKTNIPQENSENCNNSATEQGVKSTTFSNLSLLTNLDTTPLLPEIGNTSDEQIYNLHYTVWSKNPNDVFSNKNSPICSSPKVAVSSPKTPVLNTIHQTADSTQDPVISDKKKIHVTSNIIINEQKLSCKSSYCNGTTTPLRENISDKIVESSLKESEVDSSLVIENGAGTPDETNNVVFDAQCVIEKNTAVERTITRECNKYYDETDTLQQNGSPSVKKEGENTPADKIIDLCNTFAYSESDTSKNITNNSDNTNMSLSFGSSKKALLSGVGDLLSELKNEESLLSSESFDSNKNIFVTKRYRKRIRKKKKKKIPALQDQETPKPVHIPGPLKTIACPSLHLKFEDGDGDYLKVVDVTKKHAENEKENESILNLNSERCENMIVENDLNLTQHTTYDLGDFDDEYISKLPSLMDRIPNIGDIIAFKILRLSTNYNPEISKFIIGRVTEYTPESKEIEFQILRGLDQCKEPEGIFSVAEPDVNHLNVKREFNWSNLMQPRLLK